MTSSLRPDRFRAAACSAFLILGLAAFSRPAEAWEIRIVNNLDLQLQQPVILNRQAYKIKSKPPVHIEPNGGEGSFRVGEGKSLKNGHLKVQYFVGPMNSPITVEVGINRGECFAHSNSDEIEGNVSFDHSYDNCRSGHTTTYTFSPAQ